MSFFSAFSAGNNKKAAQAGAFYAQQGQQQANGWMDAARAGLTDAYGRAQSYFAPMQGVIDRGMRGYDAYGDATGVNGAEGMARARALFTALPGYQEGLTSGLDQMDRRAASRGMLASGNNNLDTMKYGQDYANRFYGDYVNRLAPYLAAPGQQMGLATAQAGLEANRGNKFADLFASQAGQAMQTGQAMGNAMGNFYKANDEASKNQIGAAMKGVDLLVSLFGAGGGMSGLSGLFGGGAAPMNIKPTGMLY